MPKALLMLAIVSPAWTIYVTQLAGGPQPSIGGCVGIIGGGNVFVGNAVVGIVGVLVATGPTVFVEVGSCGGIFGTHSDCPVYMVGEVRQLANISCSAVTP
jgi:hypothetical protein